MNPDDTVYKPICSAESRSESESHAQILNEKLKTELRKERKEKEDLKAQLAKALAETTAPPTPPKDVLVVPVQAEKGKKKKNPKLQESEEEQLVKLQARLDTLEREKVEIAEARNLAEDTIKKMKAEASSKDDTYKDNKRSMKATIAASRTEVDKLKKQLEEKDEQMRLATSASNDAHAAAISMHVDNFKKLDGEFQDQRQMSRTMGETIMTLQEDHERMKISLAEKEALLKEHQETIDGQKRGIASGLEHLRLKCKRTKQCPRSTRKH